MKKLFLILMLFIVINLYGWEERIEEMSGLKFYVVISESDDVISANTIHQDRVSIMITRIKSGHGGMSIMWGDYIGGDCFANASGYLDLWFDNEKPYSISYVADANLTTIMDEGYNDKYHRLILDFKRSDVVVIRVFDWTSAKIIKFSLKGFTKAYEKMLSKWRKDN